MYPPVCTAVVCMPLMAMAAARASTEESRGRRAVVAPTPARKTKERAGFRRGSRDNR